MIIVIYCLRLGYRSTLQTCWLWSFINGTLILITHNYEYWVIPRLVFAVPSMQWVIMRHVFTVPSIHWVITRLVFTVPSMHWVITTLVFAVPSMQWVITRLLFTVPSMQWVITTLVFAVPSMHWVITGLVFTVPSMQWVIMRRAVIVPRNVFDREQCNRRLSGSRHVLKILVVYTTACNQRTTITPTTSQYLCIEKKKSLIIIKFEFTAHHCRCPSMFVFHRIY